MNKSENNLPPVCDLGDIPDYMAKVYTKASELLVPSFLKENKFLEYMVIGGRAANQYSNKHVPSADWDIILNVKNDGSPLKQAVVMADKIRKYVQARLNGWKTGAHIDIETKDFGDHYMFQVGIVDPYTGRSFKFVDLHTCHDSQIPLVGNYCDYIHQVKIFEDIKYAPKDFVKKELSGVLARRKSISKKTDNVLSKDFGSKIEKLEELLDDTFDELDDEIDKLSKNEKAKQMLNRITNIFEKYSSYCRDKLRYLMLSYKENLKYKRTHDRYNSLKK